MKVDNKRKGKAELAESARPAIADAALTAPPRSINSSVRDGVSAGLMVVFGCAAR